MYEVMPHHQERDTEIESKRSVCLPPSTFLPIST